MGCVDGFKWCDVAWNGNRGWIDGRFLDSIYKDHHVSIIESGPQVDAAGQSLFSKDHIGITTIMTGLSIRSSRYWHTTTTSAVTFPGMNIQTLTMRK